MSETAKILQAIQVGDTVVYTDSFLDRHCRFYIDMLAAQGRVKGLHHVRNLTFAEIEWNRRALPKRVNVKYLTRTLPPPARITRNINRLPLG